MGIAPLRAAEGNYRREAHLHKRSGNRILPDCWPEPAQVDSPERLIVRPEPHRTGRISRPSEFGFHTANKSLS